MRIFTILIGSLIGLIAFVGCGKPQADVEEQRISDAPAAPPSAPVDYDPAKAFVTLENLPPKVSAPQAPESEPVESREQARVDRVLNEAREQFDQRLYTSAILTLEKGLRRHATNPEIHRLLGAVCFHQGSTGRAKSHLERAVELNPDDVMSHALLGKIAEQTGELGAATTEYRTALLASDNGRPVYRILATMWLGAALEGEGYLSAAIEAWNAYEQARSRADAPTRQELERWSADTAAPETAHVHIAGLYARLGKYDQATAAMSAAVRAASDPKRGIELQARYAELAARAGRADEALATAAQLLAELAARPDLDDATARETFVGIKGIYDALDRPDRLVSDLRAAVGATPQPLLLSLLAEQQIADDDVDGATETFRALLDARPGDRENYWRLAELQAKAANPLGALQTLAAAIAQAPSDAPAAGDHAVKLIADADVLDAADDAVADRPEDAGLRYLLGRLLQERERTEDAAAMFRDAISVSPAFQAAYVALGSGHIKAFEWKAAIDVAEEAVAAGLDGAPIQRIFAQAYDGLDEFEKAEAAYLAAIDANPHDADSMVDLGNLWVRMGDKLRKAQRSFDSALAVDPSQTGAYFGLLRFYLAQADGEERVRLASELVSRMKRHAGSTPEYARARAMLDFVEARMSNPFAPDLIERYIAALEAIVEAHPDEVGALLEIANVYDTRGEYGQAEKTIRRALKRDPDNPDARAALFRSLHRSLRQAEAADVLRGLIEDFPRRAFFWERLTAMYLIDQEWDTAIPLLKQLVDEPFMADMRQRLQAELVNTLDLAGRSDEAVEVARGYYETDPDDLAAQMLFASILQATGRDDEFFRLAESQYLESPDEPAAKAMFVDAALAAGKHELALARVIKWLENDPENGPMNGVLFSALLQADAHESAIELARSYRAGVEDDDGYTLVQALLAAGRDNDAVEVGREFLRKRNSVVAQEWYAMQLIQAGRYAEAETYLRQLANAQQRYDYRKTFLLRLSYCYQQMGELEAAENALTEIFRLNPGDVEICNDLGYTWADAGKNLEQAEEMIRRALATRPRSSAYLDSLGWVRYKRGDFAEARTWLQRATRSRPLEEAANGVSVVDTSERTPGDDPILYDHLGDAAYQMGDREGALAAWRKALELNATRDPDAARDDSRVIAAVEEKVAALESGSVPVVAEVIGDVESDANETDGKD